MSKHTDRQQARTGGTPRAKFARGATGARVRRQRWRKLGAVAVSLAMILSMSPFGSFNLSGFGRESVQAYAGDNTAETVSVVEYMENNIDETKVVLEEPAAPEKSIFEQLFEAVFGQSEQVEESSLRLSGYMMRTDFLLADQARLSSLGFDESTATINGLYQFDQASVIANYERTTMIYEGAPESDYYVAFIDTTQFNGAGYIASSVFANGNNADPQILDEVVYDEDKGIVYIPKNLINNDALKVEGSVLTGQFIVMYSWDDGKKSDVVVEVENNNDSVTAPAQIASYEMDTLNMEMRIPIATPDTAANISMDNISIKIDDVLVVDHGQENENRTYELAAYDDSTGELVIAQSPLNVASISVKIDENSLFATPKANAYYTDIGSLPTLDQWCPNGLPIDDTVEGDLYWYSGSWVHTQDSKAFATWSAFCNPINEYAGDIGGYAMQYYGDKGGAWFNLSELEGTADTFYTVQHSSTWYSEIYGWVDMPHGTLHQVYGYGASELDFGSVSDLWNPSYDGSYVLTVSCAEEDTPSWAASSGTVMFRILYKGSEYALITLLTSVDSYYGWTNQAAGGIYKVKIGESKGGIRIVKEDADTGAIPQGDATLAGAEFKVKQDGSVIDTLTSAEKDGTYAAESDPKAYKKGDYTVVESKAPTGYTLDTTEQSVTVEPKMIKELSQPYKDTVWRGDIEVIKYDDTTGTSATQGDAPDFAGISFDIINRSASAVQSPEDPSRLVQPGEVVCRITTKKDGDAYKASTKNTGVNQKSVGSGTWNTPSGWHGALAYGQYEVVEVSTAEGYMLGSYADGTQKVFHGAATTSGTAQSSWLGDNGKSVAPSSSTKWINADKALVSFTTNANGANNSVIRGDIELVKYDENFDRSENQGDAALAGAQFDIINRSAGPVVSPEDGTTLIQPGQVVCRITTKKDTDGTYKASTAASGNQKKSGEGTWSKPSNWRGSLAYGQYEIVEVAAPEGYMLSDYSSGSQSVWHGYATVQGAYEAQWLPTNDQAFKPDATPYWINGDKVVVKFDEEKNAPHDTVKRGDVELIKYDDTLKRSEAQGNATLEDIQYDIINRSAGKVISPEDGREVAPGEVVCRITTKYVDGVYKATTAATGVNQKSSGSGTWDTPAEWHGALAYGQYQIKEVEPSIGYMLGKWNNNTQKVWNGAVSKTGSAPASWNVTVPDDAYSPDSEHKWIDDDKVTVSFNTQPQGPNNTVMRGDLDVQKADAELEATDSTNAVDRQGMALLANCIIEIYNRSDAVVVSPEDGREVQPGELVCTIITDKDGFASTELTAERIAINGWDNCFAKANGWHGALAYGEYEVIERQPSEGYMLNKNWHGMAVDYTAASPKTPNDYAVHDGEEKQTIKPNSEQTWINADKVLVTFGHKEGAGDDANKASWLPEQVIRGGVKVGKVDRQNQMYKAQGKADLENHVLAIYSRNLHPVKIHAMSSEVSNRAASEDVVLPAWDTTATAQSAASTTMKLGTQTRDGVLVAYINTKQVEENGQIKYIAETDVDTLPYGIYRIKEVFVPSKSGYLFDQISADWYEDFAIGSDFSHREFANQSVYVESITNFKNDETYHTTVTPTEQENDRTYVDLTNDPKYCLSNYVLRGDVTIHKKMDNTDSDVLEFVPFVIVSKTTGEAHIVVTDKNGDATTIINHQASTLQNDDTGEVLGYTLHTFETDKNDEGVLALTEGTKIPALALDENSENGLADINTIVTLDSRGNVVNADGETPDFQWAYGTWFNGRVDAPTSNIRMAWQSSDWQTGGTNYIVYEVEDATIDNALGALPFDDYVVFELKVPDRDVTDLVDGETLSVRGNENVILVANGTFSVTNTNGEYVNMADSASRTGKEVIGWSNPTQADIRSGRYPQQVTLDNQKMLGLGTTLTDSEGNHMISADGTITLWDTVQYEGAEIGTEYTIKGELHKAGVDGEGNKVDDGIIATAETSFTASTAAGEAVIEFTFNSDDIDGGQVVAFEYMYNANGTCVGFHDDIDDEGQTVGIVKIRTTLTGEEGEKEVSATEPITLVDTVAYSGVIEGHEYTMTGTLHVRNTDGTNAGPLLDAEGNEITASATFTPETANGTVEITFEIPAGTITGKQVVAFEELYENEILLAVHADINDQDQTVWSPGICTTALDGITADHLGLAEGEITINDIVEYTNLIKGRTYTIDGTLMDRLTGEAIKFAEGDVVKGTKTFTAGYNDDGSVDESAVVSKIGDVELVSGTVEVPFHPNAEDIKGKATVVFEKLYAGGEDTPEEEGEFDVEISKTDATTGEELPGATLVIVKDGEEITRWVSEDTPHTVKLDEGTYELTEITAPKGYEVAETIEFTVGEDGTVEGDKVEMKDQPVDVPEGEFDVEISKTDAATSEELPGATIVIVQDGVTIDEWVSEDTPHTVKLDAGTYELIEITAPDGYDVAETITFVVNEDGTVEGDKVEMKDQPINEELIAVHEDINDDNQSVNYPEIRTLAHVDGAKAGVTAAGEVHLTDTVSYTNLIPGREYVMNGVLMDKVTGQVATTPDGQQVTAQTVFVPETASGTVDMEFVFNARALQYHETVVFENLFAAKSGVADELIHVAKHEDIDDAAQTVGFGEDDLADELITATGDDTAQLFAIIAAAAVALGGAFVVRRKR